MFRAGGAINYAAGADQAGLNVSVPDFLSLGSPGYGLPAAILKNGDPYAPGNVYGNPVLTFNSFYNPSTPQYPAPAAPGVVPPSSPFISIASNAARLPRIFQWSIGFQREISKDMVVEAAYVGNRGAWWTAPLLSTHELQRRLAADLAVASTGSTSKTRPTSSFCLRRLILPA